jgi:hypothetical protein
VTFYNEELLTSHPNPKLENHLFSIARKELLTIFEDVPIEVGLALHISERRGSCLLLKSARAEKKNSHRDQGI